MIKSMTGYGKAECLIGQKKATIEIKSLNSKFLDVNARIPNELKEKELEMRNIISAALGRGKVDFIINYSEEAESSSYSLNKPLAIKYFEELKSLAPDVESDDFKDYLPVIVRLPDVMVPASKEFSDSDWQSITYAMNEALRQVNDFRGKEGVMMLNDLSGRNNQILQLLGEVPAYELHRIENLKQKIKKDLFEVVDQEDVDMNRFEQELIYYLDKLDIAEEKTRLLKHCEYFAETLDEPESKGKKLSFISQEMGREINTLGSKANDANIQRLVVQMKDELEKIKEQLFNVL